ncbi:hypothetical protein Q1695_015607 [Nippostrongylus brasiliensis]|nr:hypothetical protein Q1695_015607 [Nippostrongylus brasiliensis]
MNMSKTQFMVNQWCDTGLVKLNGVALQRVDSYVYLGRELNMENDLALEIAPGDAQHGQPSVRSAKSPIRKRSLPHWMQVARDRAVWKSCGPR